MKRPDRLPSLTLALMIAGATGALRAADLAQTRPAASQPVEPPIARAVTFPTEDNLLLAGSYTPPPAGKTIPAPIVILLHMYRSDFTAYKPLVPHLHAAGFAVLAIDLRGHGRSVGPPEMGLADRVAQRDKRLFQQMDRDVEAAYRWLVRQPNTDPARFMLVGASVGCSVALKYAGRDRSVDGVVCLTPGTAYLGIDSLADARKYGQRPLLLLAAEDERAAGDSIAKVVEGATLQVLPTTGGDRMALHGTRMLIQVPRIEQTIAQFLVRAAGSHATEPVIASIQGEVYHPADASSARQISADNLRWFSSAQEAERRGLRPPKNRAGRSGTRGNSPQGEQFPDEAAPRR